jgi:ribosomal protein L24E
MTLPVRWRIACAVSSVLAVAALASPAEGAINTTVTLLDQPSDTYVMETGAPFGWAPADITSSTARYKPAEVAFSLVTAAPEDPRDTVGSPEWGHPSTGISWLIRTTSAAPAYDYELRYTAPGGVITGKVYRASDTTRANPLCTAQMATYSGKVYRAGIDPACIGKPASMSFGASMSYKVLPSDPSSPVIVDSTDNFSGSLERPLLGYWMVGRDGGIFSYGDAAFSGSTGAMKLNQPIVGMAADPDGKGYWFVAADGGIFAFDAPFFGSTGAMKLNKPIVGMAATPSGQGYYLVASDGGIFSFGDAKFRGSTGALKLNKPIVGMAAARNGRGYWLVASDGGIFSFGNGAGFFGSTGDIKLNQPIVGIAALPNNKGYYFVAADGGIFAFGEAVGIKEPKLGGSPVTGIAVAPDGKGVWVTRASGEVNGYGSVPSLGSLPSAPASPVVGIAALDVPDAEPEAAPAL